MESILIRKLSNYKIIKYNIEFIEQGTICEYHVKLGNKTYIATYFLFEHEHSFNAISSLDRWNIEHVFGHSIFVDDIHDIVDNIVKTMRESHITKFSISIE